MKHFLSYDKILGTQIQTESSSVTDIIIKFDTSKRVEYEEDIHKLVILKNRNTKHTPVA